MTDAVAPSSARRARLAATALVVVCFAGPVLAAAAAGLQPPGSRTLGGFGWLREPPSLEAAQVAARTVPLARWMLRSALVCALAVPVTVLVASWAGAAGVLAGRRARGAVIGAAVVGLGIPAGALWVPHVVGLRRLGVADLLPALALPALAATSPLLVLLCALATAGIPRATIEAARLEGLVGSRLWWHVVLPMTRPAVTAVGVLALLAHWGNLVEPLLLSGTEEDLTATVGLTLLRTTEVPQLPVSLAAACLVGLPPLAALVLAQRSLLGGAR